VGSSVARVCHLYTEFLENRLSGFCEILKQSDDTTSLAEVKLMNRLHYIFVALKLLSCFQQYFFLGQHCIVQLHSSSLLS